MSNLMLSVHGPFAGDRTESRSYFYDQQCVGTSYSRDGKHYYRLAWKGDPPVGLFAVKGVRHD